MEPHRLTKQVDMINNPSDGGRFRCILSTRTRDSSAITLQIGGAIEG
jgi:hypothetical protein